LPFWIWIRIQPTPNRCGSGSESTTLVFTRVLAAAKLEQAQSELTRWTLETFHPPPNDLKMIHYNEDSASQYTHLMEPADQNALPSIQNAPVTLRDQNSLPIARKSAPPRKANFLKYFIRHFVNRKYF
jgi:hypothetical protein